MQKPAAGKERIVELLSFQLVGFISLQVCPKARVGGVTTKDDAISRLLLTMLTTNMGYGYPVLKIASSPDMDFTTKYRAEISSP